MPRTLTQVEQDLARYNRHARRMTRVDPAWPAVHAVLDDLLRERELMLALAAA